MGKFNEARAAYREAESAWDKILAAETDQTKHRAAIAELYSAIGDLYADCKPDANFGGCNPEAMTL